MQPQNKPNYKTKTDCELLELFLSLSRNKEDIWENSENLLRLVNEISIRKAKGGIIDKPIINGWKQLIDYCQITMSNLKEEQFRVLFLDKNHHLIADELLQNGNVENVKIDIGQITTQALNCFASSAILLHNHPSNSANPSRCDIETTKKIAEALKPINVTIHDHLIVGRNGEIFSFKNEALL
jgi:DNA repair protein RadC